MKNLVTRSVQILALLVALAIPAFAEESNRGLYEGNLSGGGKIVFFVQGNHVISAYIFDVGGQAASQAMGSVNNGSFTLTTSANATLTGTVTSASITATLGGQNITANRVSPFGSSGDISGRFTGFASATGNSISDLKFIVDSQGNIFMIGQQNGNLIGGFGTVNIQCQNAGGDHDGDDEDEHDEHEDDNAQTCSGTFTLSLLNGGTVTGTVNFRHGIFSATFTLNGVQYTFRGDRESAFNHLANISTRGFVNTGQGQLIGGFIIRGGPKMVLIRALGPSLTSKGVSPALADPKLQLFQGQTLVRENNDWQSAPNASDIAATTLPPTDSKESAILIRLEPGTYTTVVSGADGGTGIALVEVYEMDRD
jgi:hypothetical protein